MIFNNRKNIAVQGPLKVGAKTRGKTYRAWDVPVSPPKTKFAGTH